MVSRAGDRPESVQALFSAIDSCSYPSISIDDLSSSSSAEEQNSLQIKPCGVAEEEKCLSPSDFVCLSPVMSPESHENEDGSDRTELERLPAAFPGSLDGCRTESRAAAEPALESSDSGEACSSSAVADMNSQSRRSPGVNGQHRTVAAAAAGGYMSENQHVSSDSEEETENAPEGRRPQKEKAAALKRTHVGSDEGESGCSPSEKKLKT